MNRYADKDIITLLLWRNLVSSTNLNQTIDTFSSIASNYRKLQIEECKVQYAIPSNFSHILELPSATLVTSVFLYLARTNHKIFYSLYGYNDIANIIYTTNLILTNFNSTQLKKDSIKILSKELLP
jgi:hypothetical protein